MARSGGIEAVGARGAALPKASATGGAARRAAGVGAATYARQVSGILAAATILSMGYTAYTVFAFDAGDALRNPATYVVYGASWALVASVRTDNAWAWRVLVAAMGFMLAVGVFYYPTTFPPEHQTTLGWFEYAAYMGLLLLAGYLGVQRLRGVTLTPGA